MAAASAFSNHAQIGQLIAEEQRIADTLDATQPSRDDPRHEFLNARRQQVRAILARTLNEQTIASFPKTSLAWMGRVGAIVAIFFFAYVGGRSYSTGVRRTQLLMGVSRTKLLLARLVALEVCILLALFVLCVTSIIAASIANRMWGSVFRSGEFDLMGSLASLSRVNLVIVFWAILTTIASVLTQSELYAGLSSFTVMLVDFTATRSFPSLNHILITRSAKRLSTEGVFALDFGPSLEVFTGPALGRPISTELALVVIASMSVIALLMLLRVVRREEVNV